MALDEERLQSDGHCAASILRLDSFEIPYAMSDDRKEAYSRRFLTLLLPDDQEGHRGGSGCVYRVFNAHGETFALKRLMVEQRHDLMGEDRYNSLVQGQRDAFRKEYESQQRLSGFKGFPKLYGYGYLEGDPIILMEWIEGKTLKEARTALWLEARTRQVSPPVVAELGEEVFGLLARMDYLDESFIHRDISPNNIMFRTRQRSVSAQLAEHEYDVCLIDFGSSSSAAELDASFTIQSSMLRKATPEYAPPEMLTNDLPDLDAKRKSPAIDVYALGSVLYELMTGHTPYRLSEHLDVQSYFRYKIEHSVPFATSVHEMQDKEVLQREPELRQCLRACQDAEKEQFDERRFLESVAVVDAQLSAILLQCLNVDQEKRPSAAEVENMLRTFRENYPHNIARRYAGRELVPFATSKPNPLPRSVLLPEPLDVTILKPVLPQAQNVLLVRPVAVGRQRSPRIRTALIMAAAIAICLAVSGIAGYFFDGARWSIRVFDLQHAGRVKGAALAGVLMAPPLLSLPFHWVGSSSGGKFFAGCIALVAFETLLMAVLVFLDWGDLFVPCGIALAAILVTAAMFVAFLGDFGFVSGQEDGTSS